MIQTASFQRKVVYLGLIALLLIPLYIIGNPAKGDPSDPESRPGGKLAQLRAQYDLSQAELGEIDPASASMNLATLGLKGVAAAILWTQANEHKKKENWESLVAVVNQMSKLQPHFISVWEFQSHNLSYNISVEHDDYRFRYLWVKKGIEFLIKGTRYNRREPKLFWTAGWYTGQKFGRADEHHQFRRLFADDGDFHDILGAHIPIDSEARGANGKPDNWLSARLWYNDAYDLVDNQGIPIRGKSPHIFYADGPKSLMNYADAIETEGYLDEKAEYAWRRAGAEWFAFGNRLVPTTWGENIRLNDREAKMQEVQRYGQQLDELLPGVRQQILEEKLSQLTELERRMYDADPNEITSAEEGTAYYTAQEKTQITYQEIAERAPREIRAKAHRLAQRAQTTAVTEERIARYRTNVNFEYWRTRCEVEQLPETVAARRHVYTANQARDRAELVEARKEFEDAWEKWADILKRYPELIEDVMVDDLYEEFQGYTRLLGDLDEELPEDLEIRKLFERRASLFAAAPMEAEEDQDSQPEEAPPDDERSETP